MPSAQGIVSNFCGVVAKETGWKLDVLRAGFHYAFLVQDLRDDNSNEAVRNSSIVQKMLKGFPDDNGAMTTDVATLSTMARADINLTRWVAFTGPRRLISFSVEAPANLNWSSLWFEFRYVGMTYQSPNGLRESFDPESFLSEYDVAYVQFLRDAAIERFLGWLLHGYRFKSSGPGLR